MVDKAAVGKKIYALRKKMGITQDSLAKMVNVTPQAISKWENGAALPDTCLLPALSQLFSVSIEALLCADHNRISGPPKHEGLKIVLPGLKYHRCTPPLVGCIKSSLDYIGIHVSTGWISAPYAFMLNINDQVSSMGPEYWNDRGCFEELIRNCGGVLKSFSAHKDDENITEKRREAWNMIRDAVDKGLPCYAWEMDKPLYYLVAGYDESGYYYIDPESMDIMGPKPYDHLGLSDWGILEVHIIRPGSISDNLKTLKDIFEYAINVNDPALYPPNQGYVMGLKAYGTWGVAIAKGTADLYGIAYNASFWAKCKSAAAMFLEEGKLRIGAWEELFNLAIVNYTNASKALQQLSRLFPLSGTYRESISEYQKNKAVNLLGSAHQSEMKGLQEIAGLLEEIYRVW